jgi:hypothetical protein
MSMSCRLPDRFEERLGIRVQNARERLQEAQAIASKLAEAGVPLTSSPDHFAMFTDPPQLLNGPLKRLGYVAGADKRCYPSPVDGCDYINVAASLPSSSDLRAQGWPDNVAVVYPVDEVACGRMLEQQYGNPFIHHITFGIAPPDVEDSTGFEVAEKVTRHMAGIYRHIPDVIQQSPGTLIAALPREILDLPDFAHRFTEWTGNLSSDHFKLEAMEGGGYLLQFFVLKGGRIEVALRYQTTQTFNPKSVHKISEDELSVSQGPAPVGVGQNG